MITSKITATVVLALIAILFSYDTIAEWFGHDATVSQTSTDFLYTHPAWFALTFIGIGILIGHILFSVNYADQ